MCLRAYKRRSEEKEISINLKGIWAIFNNGKKYNIDFTSEFKIKISTCQSQQNNYKNSTHIHECCFCIEKSE